MSRTFDVKFEVMDKFSEIVELPDKCDEITEEEVVEYITRNVAPLMSLDEHNVSCGVSYIIEV